MRNRKRNTGTSTLAANQRKISSHINTAGDIACMAPNIHSALDELTRMVQVIGRDQQLRQWFSTLTQKPAVERRNEIYLMSERMRAEGKNEDLVASFKLLADSRVFDAARLAFQEYDKIVA